MIGDILGILLLAAMAYYLWFLWTVWRGLKRSVSPGSNDVLTVSIIVAARNEEQNIKTCLDGLASQDYDPARFEIIIVDDHSNDRTPALASEYSRDHSRVRIKVISCESPDRAHGKPAAIACGIEAAEGEVVLCTDADCITPRGWLRSMAGCFAPDVAFVAGPVAERADGKFLPQLQRLEFLGLITSAAGLIGSEAAIICNGANIAYRKTAFRQVQGYGQMTSSCDDETLMQRITARRVGRVVFNSDPRATVLTETPSTFRDFARQRTRWAAKRGRYDNPLVLVRLIALFAFFVCVLTAALASLMLPDLRVLVLAVLVLKASAELVVLRAGARLFGIRFRLSYFLIAEILHVLYIVIAASTAQIISMRWKGRVLEQ
jgi:cellulose synthase/poly-beta-1,6-N-acetylglucosamine synthase-like glycosyltransferase